MFRKENVVVQIGSCGIIKRDKFELFTVLFVFKVEEVFMEGIKETSVFVSLIFEETPKQWGLRGDPYLWEEMRNEFSAVPVTISLEAFEKRFKEVFEKFTGAPLTRECHMLIN